MVNIFDLIDLKGGRLSNPNAKLFVDVPLLNQTYNLIEDIVQIYFDSKEWFFIDLGWYPTDQEVLKSSFFLIRVIRDEDWSEPILESKCNDLEKLESEIMKAIALITQLWWKSGSNSGRLCTVRYFASYKEKE